MTQKKRINFKYLKEQIALVATSISLALSFSACSSMKNERSTEDNSSYETIESTIDVPETSNSSNTTSDNTTTVSSDEVIETSKVSGFEQYVGETIPTVEYEIPEDPYDLFENIETHYIQFGGIEFGFDNPQLTKKIQEYFNNDLTIYDLGYLQEASKSIDRGGHSPFKEYKDFVGQNIQCQIAMYIVESLGGRMYVDEIPYEFFETYFKDYIDMLDYSKPDINKDTIDYGIDSIYMLVPTEEVQNIFLSRDIDEVIGKLGSNNDKEILRMLVFTSALRYNQTRCELAYNYHGNGVGKDFKASQVKQVRTEDGKNVLVFKQYQYDEFIKDMHDQECYKNIEDLYTPLTEDDLVKGGIDISKFDYIVQEVAGINLSLENTKDGDSRARTS